jgi:hypothetical protein
VSEIRPRSLLLQLIAAVLLGPLAALTPAAFASPPDSTWIAGIYDNADHDDVILLVTSTSSTAVELSDHVGRPDLANGTSHADPRARIDFCPMRLAFQGRAPPIA